MIQRIQTVYLLLALVLTVVCLCMPVGVFHTPEMGGDVEMYNLWTLSPVKWIEQYVVAGEDDRMVERGTIMDE